MPAIAKRRAGDLVQVERLKAGSIERVHARKPATE
jgi:hypothetical protein